ncbi:uncharacterized protein KY384_002611 [Bacidia gigantensis]|uniref:uncharacterized protein n=1 Tax=Bacidia gigantensis TaxID=2732470 RepID=UPI001D05A623|nr:uncharacterized protein KY384_002611 [Bacidia gigantensis]KAG8532734.1 hypothetical protein KY384_002611 [Bacidia gigantensis]
MRPPSDRPRSPLAGPATGPVPPFPIRLSGPIVRGFGRGSSELGIPTANIPIAGLTVGGHTDVESGVYYGWCGVSVDKDGNALTSSEVGTNGVQQAKGAVFAMVMSIGWNPFYKNKVRSVVRTSPMVHILHDFKNNFYGARMNLEILGFIRPEYDYVSKQSLIEDIQFDIEVARNSLERGAYSSQKEDRYLLEFTGAEHEQDIAT